MWFCLPETKGVTLEEMDRIFKSHTGEIDAEMLAEARRDVGLNQQLTQSAIQAVEKTHQAGEKSGSQIEVV